MSHPSLVSDGEPVHDIELLRTLRGRRLSSELRVLCVIGAHRFEELSLIDRIFPGLHHIYLFEPQVGPLAALERLAAEDPRIKVFPVAVSDTDGVATFNVASNDGESSSLLQLGSHRELFPHVTMKLSIEVPTRRLDSVLAENKLAYPDVMIIDVQGAEYMVLKSFTPEVLAPLRLIYAEVSTEAVYASSGLLSEVEALLKPRFLNIGFASIRPDIPVHGNAVFVAKADAGAAVAWTPWGRLRRAFHRFKRRLRGTSSAARGDGS
jgi:FkbM family methyltransferase